MSQSRWRPELSAGQKTDLKRLTIIVFLLALGFAFYSISHGPTATDKANREMLLGDPLFNGLTVDYDNARDSISSAASRQDAWARTLIDTEVNSLTNPKQACEEALAWVVAHEGWTMERGPDCYEFSEGWWSADFTKTFPGGTIAGSVEAKGEPDSEADEEVLLLFLIPASSAD